MRLITEAGREPIERDTLYRPVIRDGNLFHRCRVALAAKNSRV